MIEKKFVIKWIEKLNTGELKKFPSEFLNESALKEITLPGKTLVLGPELFGSFELLDTDGNSQHQADDYTSAKYILYSNRLKPENISIPENNDDITKAVKAYEKHLDELVMKIVKEYKSDYPQTQNYMEVTNQIFSSLNLQRY